VRVNECRGKKRGGDLRRQIGSILVDLFQAGSTLWLSSSIRSMRERNARLCLLTVLT